MSNLTVPRRRVPLGTRSARYFREYGPLWLLALPALLLLALYVGEGCLRLFMLVFAALGAALYALTLRKVLVLPVVIILKKFLFFVKKQLLFSKNRLL